MHVMYLQLDSSSSAGCFVAFLVFQARWAASDLDLLRIRSVLATERPPTRGWIPLEPAKVPQPGADLINMAALRDPLCATVHDGWYDMLAVKSNKPLVKLILWARG